MANFGSGQCKSMWSRGWHVCAGPRRSPAAPRRWIELFRAAASLGSDRDAALTAAVQMTSTTPAGVLGLDNIGSLRAGADANLVVLDRDLQVTGVMVDGEWQAGI